MKCIASEIRALLAKADVATKAQFAQISDDINLDEVSAHALRLGAETMRTTILSLMIENDEYFKEL